MVALSQVEQGNLRQTPSRCFASELSTLAFQRVRRDLTLTCFSFSRVPWSQPCLADGSVWVAHARRCQSGPWQRWVVTSHFIIISPSFVRVHWVNWRPSFCLSDVDWIHKWKSKQTRIKIIIIYFIFLTYFLLPNLCLWKNTIKQTYTCKSGDASCKKLSFLSNLLTEPLYRFNILGTFKYKILLYK